MKLIVGLGNPGKKYVNNRHNLGYMVVEFLVQKKGLTWEENQDLMSFIAKNNDLVLAKPTTFMNNSGDALAALARFYKIDAKDIIVINDDLDLPFGKLRLAFGGSSAGHHGMDSIIARLATPDFARLRIGIGRSEVMHSSVHVMDDFSEDDKKQLPELLEKCAGAVESYLADGIVATMNKFN